MAEVETQTQSKTATEMEAAPQADATTSTDLVSDTRETASKSQGTLTTDAVAADERKKPATWESNIITVGQKRSFGFYVTLIKKILSENKHENVEVTAKGKEAINTCTKIVDILVRYNYCTISCIRTGSQPRMTVTMIKTSEFQSIFESFNDILVEKRQQRADEKAKKAAEVQAEKDKKQETDASAANTDEKPAVEEADASADPPASSEQTSA